MDKRPYRRAKYCLWTEETNWIEIDVCQILAAKPFRLFFIFARTSVQIRGSCFGHLLRLVDTTIFGNQPWKPKKKWMSSPRLLRSRYSCAPYLRTYGSKVVWLYDCTCLWGRHGYWRSWGTT